MSTHGSMTTDLKPSWVPQIHNHHEYPQIYNHNEYPQIYDHVTMSIQEGKLNSFQS